MRNPVHDIDDSDTTTENLVTTLNDYTVDLHGALSGTVERFGLAGDEFYTVEMRDSANTLVACVNGEGVGLDALDASQVFFILQDEAAGPGILG